MTPAFQLLFKSAALGLAISGWLVFESSPHLIISNLELPSYVGHLVKILPLLVSIICMMPTMLISNHYGSKICFCWCLCLGGLGVTGASLSNNESIAIVCAALSGLLGPAWVLGLQPLYAHTQEATKYVGINIFIHSSIGFLVAIFLLPTLFIYAPWRTILGCYGILISASALAYYYISAKSTSPQQNKGHQALLWASSISYMTTYGLFILSLFMLDECIQKIHDLNTYYTTPILASCYLFAIIIVMTTESYLPKNPIKLIQSSTIGSWASLQFLIFGLPLYLSVFSIVILIVCIGWGMAATFRIIAHHHPKEIIPMAGLLATATTLLGYIPSVFGFSADSSFLATALVINTVGILAAQNIAEQKVSPTLEHAPIEEYMLNIPNELKADGARPNLPAREINIQRKNDQRGSEAKS